MQVNEKWTLEVFKTNLKSWWNQRYRLWGYEFNVDE